MRILMTEQEWIIRYAKRLNLKTNITYEKCVEIAKSFAEFTKSEFDDPEGWAEELINYLNAEEGE